MIDNFELIKPLLSFDSDDDFYFVQILQRKKDNKDSDVKYLGSNNSSRLIKAYNITSIEMLEKYKHEMVGLANMFNARVGINLNKRSFYKTAFNTMRDIANLLHNKEFKSVYRAWNTACGVHNGGDKIWILDVDQITNTEILLMFDNPEGRREFAIRKVIQESQPINLLDKVIAKIPSKSGYHLITTGFDSREFCKQFPEIEIHKNNPTNLYIP